MEQTKLTVRVSRDLLDNAKRYADENHTTLTRLITEFLRQLRVESSPLADAPIVKRLSGILPPEITVEDYHQYLEEKYGG
jgi:hypothetical protein